jgi:hypothetical protein
LLRPRFTGGIVLVAALVAACGGSVAGSAAPAPAASAAADPAAAKVAAGAAVSAFVGAMQAGDGTTACGLLADAEREQFVANAADLAAFASAATTCESLVAAYPTVIGDTVDGLTGRFEPHTLAGDIASGDWVYTVAGGSQRVLLQLGPSGWQLYPDANDFPSALLHWNE